MNQLQPELIKFSPDSILSVWNLTLKNQSGSNITDFQRHSKTRFTQDNFIEELDFDYLSIEVIEEG